MRLPRLVLGLPLLTLFACNGEGDKKAGPPPAAQVDVEAVKRVDVPLFVESVASVDGYVNADIRARVRGFTYARKIFAMVLAIKEGDLLFTIEATEFQANVASAKAAVARAKSAKQPA